MKIDRILVVMLLIIVFLDGFENEFTNPSPFDIMKWVAVVVTVFCYVLSVKKNKDAE